MRNPLARYYDFAVGPRHRKQARFWLMLPLFPPFLLIIAIGLLAKRGFVSYPFILNLAVYVALAAFAIWCGYIAFRMVIDVIAAIRWVRRETRPSWTSGWRAAWRVLFRRSGKSG